MCCMLEFVCSNRFWSGCINSVEPCSSITSQSSLASKESKGRLMADNNTNVMSWAGKIQA